MNSTKSHHESMPTFQTIGIHSEIHTRLVTEDASTALGQNRVRNASNFRSSSENDTTNQQSGMLSLPYTRIETPHALLSRNPRMIRLLEKSDEKELPRTKSIPLSEINQLRQKVAYAMIEHSSGGHRAKRIRSCTTPQSSIGHDINSSDDTTTLCKATERATSTKFTGTNTALELFHFHRLHHLGKSFSTGCPSLDDILAMPMEYQCLATHSYPPSTTELSDCSRGIPLSYISQISGPPGVGKTQLALQTAALALTSNQAKVWYICSTAASIFPCAKRLQDILTKKFGSVTALTVLGDTEFLSASNEYELLQSLVTIESRLDANEAENPRQECLIVIDALTTMLINEDHDMYSDIILALKGLVRTYSAAVLALQGVTAAERKIRRWESIDPQPVDSSDDENDTYEVSGSTTKGDTTTGRRTPRSRVSDYTAWVSHGMHHFDIQISLNFTEIESVPNSVQATLLRHPTRKPVYGPIILRVFPQGVEQILKQT